jgi:uncharacterized protein
MPTRSPAGPPTIQHDGDAGSPEIHVVARIADLDANQWDACANPDPATYNPFVAHAFLRALEDSKCVGGRSGWRPQHLVVPGPTEGAIAACMPAYVKGHSQGEYVFDHGWAEAYDRAGGQYYPKLQAAVPFSPVPGPRLLVRPGVDAPANRRLLMAGAASLASQAGLSSVHITFMTEAEWQMAAAEGWLQRTDQQFHWVNQTYASFDEFLAALSSRKRKTIRKEREQALASGLAIEQVTGAAITEAHWDAMYQFYQDTGNRKYGRPYLNRAFFSELGRTMADRCLLVLAHRAGPTGITYVAGALNLIGGDCLYGRYWGAIEQHPCLHFEVCYYQAIDFAIRHKLTRVEAGAQGEHKLARGYMPSATYSAHWIADPGFRKAVARYLNEERRHVAERREMLAEFGPFRKTVEEGD